MTVRRDPNPFPSRSLWPVVAMSRPLSLKLNLEEEEEPKDKYIQLYVHRRRSRV